MAEERHDADGIGRHPEKERLRDHIDSFARPGADEGYASAQIFEDSGVFRHGHGQDQIIEELAKLSTNGSFARAEEIERDQWTVADGFSRH